ncbi:MAG: lipopolysaccharide kinase InaA family protein [Methylotenera sp.]
MTKVVKAAKQPSMLTKRVILDGLLYILRGAMRVKNGHLPIEQHGVPADFIGVCVASQKEAAVDSYVVAQIKLLGVKRVRLDFTYGDLENHNARFLNHLILEGLDVTLHVIQPFESAKNMHLVEEQLKWRGFLTAVFNAFGQQIKAVEIGNTINRKRWAGYDWQGFMRAWHIAHQEIRSRNIPLIGPNIQDFEPVYNISLLRALKHHKQLPDLHSNNLFVERVTEPERFDHRILKYQWAKLLKYNLVKKARILQKIGQDFGVMHTVSSVAFWAIYRIQRLLPDGEQKQADYAARYFLLLAASGAISHANWGSLICQREGLIDDGLTEDEYPSLERVAYYKSADGELKNYRQHPSFNAVKTVANILQGAQYVKPVASAKGLEIHYFIQGNQHIHAAWTINGRAAFVHDIYSPASLANAKLLNRDGDILEHVEIITESPIYLVWQTEKAIQAKTNPQLAQDLRLHAHIQHQQYYTFSQEGWRGVLLAKDANEAKVLFRTLHPKKLQAPGKNEALRHARNAIWSIDDPRYSDAKLTVKQPVKMHFHKAYLDRFKPSKAMRSWNGAMELLRRGVATAKPTAYFEKTGDTTLKENFYICEYVKHDFNIGQAFVAFGQGEQRFLGFTTEQIYTAFAQYCHLMHSRGIYFRDLSGGNVLVNILPNQQLHFSLIDTARLYAYHYPTPIKYRIADLTRALNKLHWAGRERFLRIYLSMSGRQLTWRTKLAFYLYDFKVDLKRKIGRKGWKRLINRFKASQAK